MTGPRFVVPAVALAVSAAGVVTFGALTLAGPPVAGSVEIQTAPPGASVFVDGVFRGTSPATVGHLGPGTHALRLEKADFEPLVTGLAVRNRQSERLFELTRAARGTLEVNSGPPGAEAFLDGRYRGVTPLFLEGLRTGRHALSVEKANHKPWSGTVLVSDGRLTEVSCELEDRVLEYLKKALADAPREILRYMELGHYHYVLGDTENATDVYRRGLVLAQDRLAEFQHKMMQARDRSDDEERQRLASEYEKAKFAKKKLEQQIQRDCRSGPREFRAAMEEAKRSVRAQFPQSVAVALKEADAAERRGEFDRAAEIIERAVKVLPGSARLWERLAICHAKLGTDEELNKALSRAFRLSGTDAGVRVRLARACLENAERLYGKARRKLFATLAHELARTKRRGTKDQQRLHALLEYKANREAGRIDKAVRALKESIKNTDDPRVIEELREEARRWLEDVARDSPDKSARSKAKAELRRF